MKEKLFKLLFPKKYVEMKDLKRITDENIERRMKEAIKSKFTVEDLVCQSLGLPTGIDFSNVDNEGMPPHYFKGLSDEQRKLWIGDLETIYANDKFQTVVKYVINMIGNHGIQKAPDDKMRNSKIAIIGIRTLLTELKTAHEEFSATTPGEGGFDPLATMPE